MTTPLVYQFPISHYCEVTRWAMEAKGLPYRTRNVAPGPHRKLARRLGLRSGTVPILCDGDVVLGDSLEIFEHLESRHPAPALLPTDPAGRARARALAAHFWAEAGAPVRLWNWSALLTEPGQAALVFFHGYAAPVRWLGRLMLSAKFDQGVRRLYDITAESEASARTAIDAALAHLEREIDGDPGRYLAGDRLSIADITAAALLGPLVGPPGSPWDIKTSRPVAAMESLRRQVRERPAGRWVLERYRRDRRAVAA